MDAQLDVFTHNNLAAVVERLMPLNPAKVILFGSYASGTATPESDLDLLVVTQSETLPQSYSDKEQMYLEVARLLRDIRRKTPMDLIVHTRAMHKKFIELNSLFAREVLENGVVLYESHNA